MTHVGSARGRAAMAGDGAGYAGRWPRARLGAAAAAQAAAVAHASGARVRERERRWREREAVVELQQKRVEEGESTRGLSTANAWR